MMPDLQLSPSNTDEFRLHFIACRFASRCPWLGFIIRWQTHWSQNYGRKVCPQTRSSSLRSTMHFDRATKPVCRSRCSGWSKEWLSIWIHCSVTSLQNCPALCSCRRDLYPAYPHARPRTQLDLLPPSWRVWRGSSIMIRFCLQSGSQTWRLWWPSSTSAVAMLFW